MSTLSARTFSLSHDSAETFYITSWTSILLTFVDMATVDQSTSFALTYFFWRYRLHNTPGFIYLHIAASFYDLDNQVFATKKNTGRLRIKNTPHNTV